MSIHVCQCTHKGNVEYHLRYPGMSEQSAQTIASKINQGKLDSADVSFNEIEQLYAFSLNESTFPGDTIAHYIANSLVDKGYAVRNNGDFVITPKGEKLIEKLKTLFKGN